MKLSVVTTMYYSSTYLKDFYFKVTDAIEKCGINSYEIIFVNDGSPDDSSSVIRNIAAKDSNIKLVELSRNFGHHNAIIAGLSRSCGDYVYLIDCDLEEHPDLLCNFWQELKSSDWKYDVVYGIQSKRKGNYFERISGKIYYYLLSMLSNIDYPANTLTARIMSRRYVDKVLFYKEKAIDVWGIFALVGFDQRGIVVDKKSKGQSTYTLKRKINMAIETITSLSSKPLYFIFLIGFFMVLFSFLWLFYIIVHALITDMSSVEGWASLMASIWFVGGLLIFALGVIAIYLSKIFIEVKGRPLFVIKEETNQNNENNK